MSVRAGILITGTEVLTGIISDRNGPWLSERLLEIGVDAEVIQIVGDRAEDLLAALEFMAGEGVALIVTSGGLGPTADDLTAEVVGRFSGREMVLDAALEERIAEILRPMMRRWQGLDRAGDPDLQPQAGRDPSRSHSPRAGRNRSRARRRTAAREPRPTVVVLPGPPRELHPMWEAARATEAFAGCHRRGDDLRAADRATVRDSRVGDRQHAASG